MKILIVDTFYTPYLQQLYRGSSLDQQSWAKQHKAHFAGGFGTGDAYSHGLARLGVEAIEIVANSVLLQQAWAQEHHPELLQSAPGAPKLLAILEAQIRWWKPTVLYVQDINWLPAAFLNHVKTLVEMVVGQNACPLAPGLDLTPYNLLLTSLPHYVGRFRSQGVPAAFFPIGFDERLLERHHTDRPRSHMLTFIGGLGGSHSRGTQMLEAIAQELPLQVWGYGGQQLPADSTLRQRWRGEAWAEDMYGLLASSQITLNRHIDIADSYANNMRLYEATGMGACLLTDAKANLPALFEPDQEVVTYQTPQEAVSKLQQLLKCPQQAAAIARRGQLRVLRDHTYSQRMGLLVELLLRHSPKPQVQGIPYQDQQVLVACPHELVQRLPQSLRRVLTSQHPHHHFTLLTDAPAAAPALQGLPRWCPLKQADADGMATCCIDAIAPTQVFIVKDSFSKGLPNRWLANFEQQSRRKDLPIMSVPVALGSVC